MRYRASWTPGATGRGSPSTRQLDVQAGLAHAVDQIRDLAQARLGSAIPSEAVGPQDVQEAAHLVEGLATGSGHRPHGVFGLVGVVADGVGGGLGLDDHHAQVVGHHVVQLAGDGGSFGGHGLAHLGLPVGLQAIRPASSSAM